MGECVYVIGAPGSNTVKIGRSADPQKRLAEISRMSPVRLEILWSHPGGFELETNIHRQFSALRTHGEWFTFGGDPVSRVRWAVKNESWLRPRVDIRKKNKRLRPRPEDSWSDASADPQEITYSLLSATIAWTQMFSAIDNIKNRKQRFEALACIEVELSKAFRDEYQKIAIALKQEGLPWRTIGDLMGGVSPQRAHQISLGGAPRYGAKAAQK